MPIPEQPVLLERPSGKRHKEGVVKPRFAGLCPRLHASPRRRRPCPLPLTLVLLLALLGLNPARTSPLVEPAGAIVRGPVQSRQLALVFTAHEFGEGGETILDALQRHDAKASFFLTGDFLRQAEFGPLVQRMLREGHYVGPHSDKHLLYCGWETNRPTLVTRDAFRADLEANRRELARLGVPNNATTWFLPAYEHYNRDISAWSRELGLTLVNHTPGTRSAADYTGETNANFVSSQAILDSIWRRENSDPHGLNGFLLLFHLGVGPGRADKLHVHLDRLMGQLQGKGYRLVRVDELLAKAPSETNSTARVHVRASQVGYGARTPKLAMAFSTAPLPQGWQIVQAGTDREVLHGALRPVTRSQWGQFVHFAEIDFTPLDAPGRYALRVGTEVSHPFRIGPGTLAELPDALLEFMRQQRCGDNPWLDALCHQHDARTAYGPLPAGTELDARGGWHDAADLLKYLLTSGNATAQMLLAYELQRTFTNDPVPAVASNIADRFDASGRPASNGVPDLLDEARWGLEWMLKLHPSPDQLYHQVADDRDHCGWRLPQNEVADYGWGKGSNRVVYCAEGRPQGLGKYQSESTGVANLAGRYAAAMALAWQIWRDDPAQRSFAARCLQAGREVYALGRAREGVQQGNSYSAPYRYAETTWADDMEWGAAELFRATGESRFLDEARRYASLAAAESWMGRDQSGHYQFYPFLNLGHYRLHGVVDPAFQRVLAGYYRDGLQRCREAAARNPFDAGVPFIWCSNNLLTALATQGLLYERMTGDPAFREFTARQQDWLLGRNPWGVTMFTGIGALSPGEVHLMTTRLTGRRVRGGLVDGPVREEIFRSLKGVSIREPDPLAPFQDARAVYHDDLGDYSTNEPTMDGTASAILLWTLASLPR